MVGLSDLQDTRIAVASHDFMMNRVLNHTMGSQSVIRSEFFPLYETEGGWMLKKIGVQDRTLRMQWLREAT